MFKLVLIIDGQLINYLGKLSAKEMEFVGKIYPVLFKITAALKNFFIIMNISICNYFIIGILKFYNLTLLYIFLKVKLLPSFVRMFLINLAYIFFTRGSIQ
jgi:hypothetical protein